MSGLVLGIDGGQTATIAVVATEAGEIVGTGVGGAILHHDDASAEAAASAAVEAVLATALPEEAVVTTACLSLTGSSSLVRGMLAQRLPELRRVRVLESDALAALASGVGNRGGVGVIAGTGSVAVARTARGGGRHELLGGWGWLMGDQGSGFAIGLAGLRAAALAADGVGPETALVDDVRATLRIDDLRDAYNLLTGRGFTRATVGRIAPRVTALAAAGDAIANSIVDEASAYLVGLAAATVARLEASRSSGSLGLGDDERVIVPAGGVLEAGAVRERFDVLVQARMPGFAICAPIGPPVLGAVLLALADAGTAIDVDIMRLLADQAALRPDLGSKSAQRSNREGNTR